MSYSSAAVLQMPSSYVPMSTEEMEYVEGGGWTTYKGAEALTQLTVMAAQVYGSYVAAAKLGKVCAATAATGWGLVLAVASGLGMITCITAGSTQACFFAAALLYYRQDRKFDAYSVSIWNWSASLGVRRSR